MEHKLGGNRAILVVSPLVALMGDQVYGLKKSGVRASSVVLPLRWPRKTSLQLFSALAAIYSFVLQKPLPQRSGKMPLKERDSLHT